MTHTTRLEAGRPPRRQPRPAFRRTGTRASVVAAALLEG